MSRASATNTLAIDDDNDRLIPRGHALESILCISPATAWRKETVDPAFPQPVCIGSRVFYRKSEINRYIAQLPRAPREAVETVKRNLASITTQTKKAKAGVAS